MKLSCAHRLYAVGMQTDKRRRDLGAVAIMPARVSSMAQILVCRLLVYCQQVETTQGSSTKKNEKKKKSQNFVFR